MDLAQAEQRLLDLRLEWDRRRSAAAQAQRDRDVMDGAVQEAEWLVAQLKEEQDGQVGTDTSPGDING